MKGQTGTPMVAHSRFKTKEDYWKWVKLKNKSVNTKKQSNTKHYRYQKDGEWVDVYVEE